MIFLLDHDVPNSMVGVITQAGHGAERIAQSLPADTDDATVLAFAHSRRAVLITCNRDHFLSLARTRPHSGIIVLVRRATRVAECSRLLRLLEQAGENGIRDNINFA